MGSLAKESLRKVCGASAENSRKYEKLHFMLLRQERVRKFCGKLQKFRAKCFCNDPFPNDPISELLITGPLVPLTGPF